MAKIRANRGPMSEDNKRKKSDEVAQVKKMESDPDSLSLNGGHSSTKDGVPHHIEEKSESGVTDNAEKQEVQLEESPTQLPSKEVHVDGYNALLDDPSYEMSNTGLMNDDVDIDDLLEYSTTPEVPMEIESEQKPDDIFTSPGLPAAVETALQEHPEIKEYLVSVTSDIHTIKTMVSQLANNLINPSDPQHRIPVLKDLEKLIHKKDLKTLVGKEDDQVPIMSRVEWDVMIDKLDKLSSEDGKSRGTSACLKDMRDIISNNSAIRQKLSQMELLAQEDRKLLVEEHKKLHQSELDLKVVYTTIRDYIAKKSSDLEKEREMRKIVEGLQSIKDEHLEIGNILEKKAALHPLDKLKTAETVSVCISTPEFQNGKAGRNLAETSNPRERKNPCFLCSSDDHSAIKCDVYPNYRLRRAMFRKQRRCVLCGKLGCRADHFKNRAKMNKCPKCKRKNGNLETMIHHASLCPELYPEENWHPATIDDIPARKKPSYKEPEVSPKRQKSEKASHKADKRVKTTPSKTTASPRKSPKGSKMSGKSLKSPGKEKAHGNDVEMAPHQDSSEPSDKRSGVNDDSTMEVDAPTHH